MGAPCPTEPPGVVTPLRVDGTPSAGVLRSNPTAGKPSPPSAIYQGEASRFGASVEAGPERSWFILEGRPVLDAETGGRL